MQPVDLLVIGGSGFVGSKLALVAIKTGWRASNRENDPPDPEGQREPYRVYAMTRAEGERVTLDGWLNSIVVRTSNVEGRDIHGNLNPRLASSVNALQKGLSLPRFINRIISPTLVDNFAEAVLEVMSDDFTYRGILHVAGSQPLSDYEYTLCLARHLGIDESLIKMNQVETSSSSKILNISLEISFTQSLLKTWLLNVPELLAKIFPAKENH